MKVAIKNKHIPNISEKKLLPHAPKCSTTSTQERWTAGKNKLSSENLARR
jgi:hypothetical protein